MKFRNILISLLCAGSIAAYAVPAKRGVVHRLPQPDGTTVELTLVGDENTHFYLTSDEKIVIGSQGRYCYASTDALGNLVNTDILAHNPGERSFSEITLANSLQRTAIEKAFSDRALQVKAESAPESRSNSQDYIGRLQTAYPTIGDVRTLVILVNFSDVEFSTPNPNEYFTRMLNEEGFSENGGKGSCRDYYLSASGGKFNGQFDVYGPVTLPNDQKYYGQNNQWGNDMRPKQMVIDAVTALNSEIDYRLYDLDEDLFVDNVFIFYAGQGEAQGGGDDTIWPHQSQLGFSLSYRFDGVYVSRYACTSELMSNGETDGIGTFCHEFGHVLGVPDLYNTTDASATYTPGDYSAMDSGCYNGNSKQPPTFSSFERNALGWMGDDLVEITGPASCRLESLIDSNKAYLINTDSPNEFFLFENRQKTNWDSTLPGKGMLVWHIDYDLSVWNSNSANNNPEHQRIDLVEACDNTGTSAMVKRRYPFPGTSNVKSFTFDGKPSFKSWSGKDLELPITDITETDGVITFNVAGGGPDPASIFDITAPAEIGLQVSNRKISVESAATVVITDLAGRVIASGAGALTTETLSPGIYIVASKGTSSKVIVK